ncbi:MAG: exodeoxyribonuclease VII large subunit [Gammaproteobacteria bacterium]|nr:exodeoxyribonuclease VII large subunit [Gammaproteobacteria bacterium]MBU1553705.1 exodeoxyribonuclease VII large subunit [Gammaproteobacteria bacterium]MBU2068715.1 exodeoxyribonuclease VII large subunit [Gammaproteobacteria bacterium]MBU2183681.1 exodeoxyribonuclease VII large subunit [Gammaproteobacteria bacterium]MBU2205900.1 exodeoxyribonuclease VII large subunit [Gammaproteobacteria bacterium]
MQNPDIYSVSRLNSEVRLTLELQFQTLWLQGEVSNFVAAASGHWYFSLKDSAAQVKCAMFKMANRNSSFRPQNGQQVLIRARISVYEPRGEYQLLAEFIESAGAGLLKQQFEQLKAKLQAEGLFDPARKKALPTQVQRVGVITSATGAAVRDIVTVLARRAPGIEVIIYPSQVQGDTAAAQLRNMLSTAIRRNEVDVLIIGRGGGSLEDLWCFNDEALCRAVAACPIPIVSAVGHEIDFALTDFVADMRAPTPSAAAELVSPDQSHLSDRILQLKNRLLQAQRSRMQQAAPKLLNLSQRLLALHPKRRLQQQQQRLDELQLRLSASIKRAVQAAQQQQLYLDKSLRQLSPAKAFTQQQQHVRQLQQRLKQAQQQQLKQHTLRLAQLSSQLNTVSPLATLARGYSITFDEKQQVVTSASQLKAGDKVAIKLAEGGFDARVEHSSN